MKPAPSASTVRNARRTCSSSWSDLDSSIESRVSANMTEKCDCEPMIQMGCEGVLKYVPTWQ
jgi:hypothetical protein